TTHGFALNVNNNLKYFSYIIPCGINDISITSVSKILGYEIEIKDIQNILLKYFSQVFDFTLTSNGKLNTFEECLNISTSSKSA
ncbi:MAG: hypothetical protein PHQ86_02725, partial [Dehalococcoidales bacterium]|nr:hypothetical protein [Dehalococcoidales bacterium]